MSNLRIPTPHYGQGQLVIFKDRLTPAWFEGVITGQDAWAALAGEVVYFVKTDGWLPDNFYPGLKVCEHEILLAVETWDIPQ